MCAPSPSYLSTARSASILYPNPYVYPLPLLLPPHSFLLTQSNPLTSHPLPSTLYFPESQGWEITGIGYYRVKMVHTGSNNVL